MMIRCAHCGEKQPAGQALQCPMCKDAHFCGERCQEMGWARHQDDCAVATIDPEHNEMIAVPYAYEDLCGEVGPTYLLKRTGSDGMVYVSELTPLDSTTASVAHLRDTSNALLGARGDFEIVIEDMTTGKKAVIHGSLPHDLIVPSSLAHARMNETAEKLGGSNLPAAHKEFAEGLQKRTPALWPSPTAVQKAVKALGPLKPDNMYKISVRAPTQDEPLFVEVMRPIFRNHPTSAPVQRYYAYQLKNKFMGAHITPSAPISAHSAVRMVSRNGYGLILHMDDQRRLVDMEVAYPTFIGATYATGASAGSVVYTGWSDGGGGSGWSNTDSSSTAWYKHSHNDATTWRNDTITPAMRPRPAMQRPTYRPQPTPSPVYLPQTGPGGQTTQPGQAGTGPVSTPSVTIQEARSLLFNTKYDGLVAYARSHGLEAEFEGAWNRFLDKAKTGVTGTVLGALTGLFRGLARATGITSETPLGEKILKRYTLLNMLNEDGKIKKLRDIGGRPIGTKGIPTEFLAAAAMLLDPRKELSIEQKKLENNDDDGIRADAIAILKGIGWVKTVTKKRGTPQQPTTPKPQRQAKKPATPKPQRQAKKPTTPEPQRKAKKPELDEDLVKEFEKEIMDYFVNTWAKRVGPSLADFKAEFGDQKDLTNVDLLAALYGITGAATIEDALNVLYRTNEIDKIHEIRQQLENDIDNALNNPASFLRQKDGMPSQKLFFQAINFGGKLEKQYGENRLFGGIAWLHNEGMYLADLPDTWDDMQTKIWAQVKLDPRFPTTTTAAARPKTKIPQRPPPKAPKAAASGPAATAAAATQKVLTVGEFGMLDYDDALKYAQDQGVDFQPTTTNKRHEKGVLKTILVNANKLIASNATNWIGYRYECDPTDIDMVTGLVPALRERIAEYEHVANRIAAVNTDPNCAVLRKLKGCIRTFTGQLSALEKHEQLLNAGKYNPARDPAATAEINSLIGRIIEDQYVFINGKMQENTYASKILAGGLAVATSLVENLRAELNAAKRASNEAKSKLSAAKGLRKLTGYASRAKTGLSYEKLNQDRKDLLAALGKARSNPEFSPETSDKFRDLADILNRKITGEEDEGDTIASSVYEAPEVAADETIGRAYDY